EHQLVRGVTGCSAPALRLQEPGTAGALSSSGRSTTPPPLSRWLLGALALTGWPVFAPETGAPTKGGGVGCRRSTRPGCEGAFPGGTTSSSVEERGLAPRRSTIRLRWLLLLPGFGVGFGVALAHGLGAFFHDQVGDQG